MADTLGGGIGVIGAIQSLRKRLEKSDLVVANELDDVVAFAKKVMADPLSNTRERLEAAKLLQRVAEHGDGIALKLSEYERIDDGKTTSKQEIEVSFHFDQDG